MSLWSSFSSLTIYLVSRFLQKSKLNALGISNLPLVFEALLSDNQQAQEVFDPYLKTAFYSAVVTAGLFDFYPWIIQANGVAQIALGVHQSIQARKLQQEHEKHQLKQQQTRRRWFWERKSTPKQQQEQQDEQSPCKQQAAAMHYAQRLLEGKRDSAMDDVLWGVFQASLLFYDVSWIRALVHAWMVFLLHVMEDALWRDDLTAKQKGHKILWLTAVAYVSGKLVFVW